MLENVVDRSVLVKKIAIATCGEALNELLQHLLLQWKFEIHPSTASDVLLLAEEGCAEPVAGQNVIWLSRTQDAGKLQLNFPLKVENLWQVLEVHFHQPPRQHIRMEIEINAAITVDEETVTTSLSSLSDMGARFDFHRELVRGQQLFVELNVGGENLRVDSRVIYAIPRSAAAQDEMKVGLLFQGIEKDQRDLIRSFLVMQYLQEVQKEMNSEQFVQALASLELPLTVRESLST